MVLVLCFETFYIVDALWNEPLVLTTMDITTDGFGFMLADGLLSWLPLNYAVQARFLAMFPVHIEWWHIIVIVIAHVLGYHIFRSANAQKDTFRRFGANDPRNISTCNNTSAVGRNERVMIISETAKREKKKTCPRKN